MWALQSRYERSKLIMLVGITGKVFRPDMERLWNVMQNHNDVQKSVPASRWDIDSVYTPFIAPDKLSVTVR